MDPRTLKVTCEKGSDATCVSASGEGACCAYIKSELEESKANFEGYYCQSKTQIAGIQKIKEEQGVSGNDFTIPLPGPGSKGELVKLEFYCSAAVKLALGAATALGLVATY